MLRGKVGTHSSNMNIANFAGKIYPDRTFSLGAVPRKTKNKAEKQYDAAYYAQEPWEYNSKINWLLGINSIEGEFVSIPKGTSLDDRLFQEYLTLQIDSPDGQLYKTVLMKDVKVDCLDRLIASPPLLANSPESSQRKKRQYGTKGITAYGKKACKNMCILMEREYGKFNLGFGTCTVPNMSSEQFKVLMLYWGDITRRFYQKVKRLYLKEKCQFDYVGCTEIQEERFKKGGLPAPHIHFVYNARSKGRKGYICSTEKFYTAWNESVNQVLIKHNLEPIMGVNGHIGSVRVEPIKTSAAAYLGKYISKGVKTIKSMMDSGFRAIPKQWWSASMQSKKRFMSAIIPLSSQDCSALFYHLEWFLEEGLVAWASFVEVEIDGNLKKIGLVGVLSNFAFISFSQSKRLG